MPPLSRGEGQEQRQQPARGTEVPPHGLLFNRPEPTPREVPDVWSPRRRGGCRGHHQKNGVKFTATLWSDWSMAVKAEPLTWAEVFWFDAPAPTACCCVVDALPVLLPPTPLPPTVATAAFDPSFAKEPLSARATPPQRATVRGSAATAARTRAVRMLAMSVPPGAGSPAS
ncbi:protein of unknown function [Streptomyces sp. KY75]|nr:protein of unknown function [Streptomyces sp. KY75]